MTQGIVLTDCLNIDQLRGAMQSAALPGLKVITAWGYPWNDSSRASVSAVPSLMIRTKEGDGTGLPAGQGAWLDPQKVIQELEPWVAYAPRALIELGNEPNASNASDDSAWNFRYWFIETLNILRSKWPNLRLIAPGLIENNQETWWRINQDAFSRADGVAFHAYAWHDFIPSDTGQIQRALQQLRALYPSKLWYATELGINDIHTSPNVKAQRYASLRRNLPAQVATCYWYHSCDRPLDDDQRAYQLPASALPYLGCKGII